MARAVLQPRCEGVKLGTGRRITLRLSPDKEPKLITLVQYQILVILQYRYVSGSNENRQKSDTSNLIQR